MTIKFKIPTIYVTVATYIGAFLTFTLLNSSPAQAGECDPQPPYDPYSPSIYFLPSLSLSSPGTYVGSVNLTWNYLGPCNDFYQLRYGIAGRDEIQQQMKVKGVSVLVQPDKPYTFNVQACKSHFLAPSTCTHWSNTEYILPYGSDTCKDGFVWRNAGSNDHVCVDPQVRQQAANDNAQAASRVSPTDRSYGPDTCIQGYVWREAFPNDHVCVIPQIRQQSASDNAQASSRRAYQGSGL